MVDVAGTGTIQMKVRIEMRRMYRSLTIDDSTLRLQCRNWLSRKQ